MAKFTNQTTGVTVEQENRTTEDLANQGFTPVEAPVVPTSTIDTPEAPPVAPVEKIEPQVINKASVLENVQFTIDRFGVDAGGNEAFIRGATKLLGREATPKEIAQGGTLGQIVERLGIGEQLKGFGVKKVEEAPIEEAPTPEQSIIEILKNTSRGDIRKQAQDEAGIQAASNLITTAETNLQGIKSKIEKQGILDQSVLDELEGQGRGITTALIAGQQANLSDEQRRDLALDKLDYNNALVELQIANGDFNRAVEISREIAEDSFVDIDNEIKALELEGKLDSDEAASLTKQAEADRDLALNGYVYIKSPEALAGLTEDQIFRDPVTGKIWKKPILEVDTATVDAYVNQIKSGGMKITNVPAELRGDVAVALGDYTAPTSNNTPTTQEPESGWDENTSKQLFGQYLNAGYDLSQARERVEELTGQDIRFGYSEAKQFIADNQEATKEELKAVLLEFTKGVLSISQVNSLLAGKEKTNSSSRSLD